MGVIVDTKNDAMEEYDWEDDEIQEARAAVQLPPMSGISTLRTLGVRDTPPPPDWRKLSSLTYLELGQKTNWRRSLAGLAQLKRLWLNHAPWQTGGCRPPSATSQRCEPCACLAAAPLSCLPPSPLA